MRDEFTGRGARVDAHSRCQAAARQTSALAIDS